MRKRNNETKHLDQDLNCDTVIKTKTTWGPQKLPLGLPGSLKHRLLGLYTHMKFNWAGREFQYTHKSAKEKTGRNLGNININMTYLNQLMRK